MAKKIKHFKNTPIVRSDGLDLNPETNYENLTWKTSNVTQDYQALDDRCKYDAYARRIVYQMPEDATRNGFRIVIPSDPDLQATYQQGLDSLNTQQALAQQGGYEFKHGDGYIAYLVRETNPTKSSDPLDPTNIDDLVALHVFGQNNVQSYQTNDNPMSEDFCKETALMIIPKQAGFTIDRYGNQVPNTDNLEPIVIDASRYGHISLDKADDDVTGTSIIKRCERQLNNMAIADETVGKMMREFTWKVFQSDRLMNESLEQFRRDREELSRVANAEDVMFIGNSDKVTKLATPAAGINVLLDQAWKALSTACGIPKSVLTGEQAGTLAGAGQDVQNYYDRVKAFQEQTLKPEIEYIVKLLMWSKNFGGGYLDPDSLEWHIEFNPLWTPDDKTQAETELLKMQTAVAAVQSGIYGPDEMRQKLDGEGNTQIQGLQNTPTTDSADIESKYTKDEIEQYKKDLEATHDGTA